MLTKIIWPFEIKNLHFMVFTATFSEVPLGCLSCPSITDPNSPKEETLGQ